MCAAGSNSLCIFHIFVLLSAPKVLVTFFNTVRSFVKITGEIYMMDSNEEKWKGELRKHFNRDGISPEFGGTCKDFVRM